MDLAAAPIRSISIDGPERRCTIPGLRRGRAARQEPKMRRRHLIGASLLSLALLGLSGAGPAFAQRDAMTYCKPDVERLCPRVEPGGGRIVKCLKAHKMEMSVGCAMALKKMKAKM
jgi:hypothetical protein